MAAVPLETGGSLQRYQFVGRQVMYPGMLTADLAKHGSQNRLAFGIDCHDIRILKSSSQRHR